MATVSGLGPVMYPPASGAGADRRQNLQPEVFILQLVASSAWGMNDPPCGSESAGGAHRPANQSNLNSQSRTSVGGLAAIRTDRLRMPALPVRSGIPGLRPGRSRWPNIWPRRSQTPLVRR